MLEHNRSYCSTDAKKTLKEKKCVQGILYISNYRQKLSGCMTDLKLKLATTQHYPAADQILNHSTLVNLYKQKFEICNINICYIANDNIYFL